PRGALGDFPQVGIVQRWLAPGLVLFSQAREDLVFLQPLLSAQVARPQKQGLVARPFQYLVRQRRAAPRSLASAALLLVRINQRQHPGRQGREFKLPRRATAGPFVGLAALVTRRSRDNQRAFALQVKARPQGSAVVVLL